MENVQMRMTPEIWEMVESNSFPDEDLLMDFLWMIAEVYDVPVTNNYPRIMEGRQLRMVGDFICDLREAFVRAGWRPREEPKDAEWADRFPGILPYEGEK